MFGKMTVGKKIAFGFALVLTLTGILGYIGFNSVNEIQSIVDKANDTNTLVDAAREARVQHLVYMRSGDRQALDSNAQTVKNIYDQVEVTHAKFQDPTDRDGIMQAKGEAKKYESSLAGWVKTQGEQEVANQTLITKARSFVEECRKLAESQKKELNVLIRDNQDAQLAKIRTVEAASELLILSKTCRVEVIKYMQANDQSLIAENDKTVARIVKVCDELIAQLKEPADRDEVARIKANGIAYKDGFDIWLKTHAQQNELGQTLVQKAKSFQKTCAQLADEQNKEMLELLKSGNPDSQLIKRKVDQSQTASSMITMAKDCRLLEKNFMLRQDLSYREQMTRQIETLTQTCQKLLSGLNEEHDRSMVQGMLSDVSDYAKTFDQWCKLFDLKNATVVKMVEHADQFFSECETLAASQKHELEELQKKSVESQVAKGWTADAANELIILTGQARIAEKNFMARQKPELLEQNHKLVLKISEICDGLVQRLKEPADQQVVRDLKQIALDYHQSLDRWDELLQKQKQQEKELVDASNSFIDQCSKLGEGQNKKMHAQINSSSVMTSSGAVITIIIGCVLAFIIASGIIRPLRRIIDGMENGANQVSQASDQVSSSSQSMAEGASEQASSLEETSASLEQMNATVRQNAENAQSANSMAEEARQMSVRGNEAMKRLTQTISKIKDSSDQTASILKTIDEIAFQTNLLALNAAVEAARAGEAGKGFAVVAEEVRSLAQRSAEASKSTAQLIEDACRNADQGVDVASEAETSLTQIDAAVTRVTELINEVSSASNEQADGIDQVTKAVSQMDQVTQANAASSEESAAASEELSAQAEELNSMVDELVGMVMGQRKINRATRTVSKPVSASKPTNRKSVASKPSRSEHRAAAVIPLDDEDGIEDF
jgi:methyl-accepting chemotaxis protein